MFKLKKKKVDYNLYPNPAKDVFTVELSNIEGSNIEVVLYDILGNSVYSEHTSDSKLIVDTKIFGKGIYFVNITKGVNTQILKVIID